MVTVHKKFNFGKAPFRWVGMWSAPSNSLAEHNAIAYNNMMSSKPKCCHHSCDHCGMGIIHHCIIRDADGKLFSVGTTCVNKLEDVENMSEFQAEVKRVNREKRRAQAEKRREKQRLEREAKIAEQHEKESKKNNGLTNHEAFEKALGELNSYKQYNIEKLLTEHDYIYLLREVNGDFAKSILRDVVTGTLPKGRARTIMLEIIGKSAGRMNSKAYNKFHDEVCERYEAYEEKVNTINDKYEKDVKGFREKYNIGW